jgi:hypothetical protein
MRAGDATARRFDLSFETFAMISFSAWVNTANSIILFEHDAELHCMRGAPDLGEYRQAAGPIARAVIR